MDFDCDDTDRYPTRVERGDAHYPARVELIMEDKAPEHLDMVGNLDLLEMPSVGFCGSRAPSKKGLEIAKDCAEQAAKNNVVVVSGNAAGIDFEAHYNSLKFGGSTILVLPEGIGHFRIRKALNDVWDWRRVLVISQFEPEQKWQVYRAMNRNQLVIALSRAIIVFEAGDKGGTLDAGKKTLKSGLPLFVAQHKEITETARGNKILCDMGALQLAKSRATNRANMPKVFEKMDDDFLKRAPRQEALI